MTFILVTMWTLLVVYSFILWRMHQRMSRLEKAVSLLLDVGATIGKFTEKVIKGVKEQQDAKEQSTEAE